VNPHDAVELLLKGDDGDMREAVSRLTEELRVRARARGDLDEMVEVGFARGFTSTGMATSPWIESGLILCPGSVVVNSSASHECSFVNVADTWIWESDEALLDVVRQVPAGAKTHQRSVSILDAREGLEFNVLVSRMRQGSHALKRGTSYVVRGGALVVVSTRAVRADGHR
jgi:hypothetical protein